MKKNIYIKPEITVVMTDELCGRFVVASVSSVKQPDKSFDHFEVAEEKEETGWLDKTDQWGGD